LSVLYACVRQFQNSSFALPLDTMSFEFMVSRCSSAIAGALSGRYAIPKAALRWFELHSEVDVSPY
jgi:hypothetical protein